MDNEFYCRGFVPGATPQRPTAPAPPGPEWARPGELPWPDALLRRVYCDSRGAFYRPDADGFLLAYPLSCRAPFPLPPLFCFARAECLGQRGWWVFAFDSAGRPRPEG